MQLFLNLLPIELALASTTTTSVTLSNKLFSTIQIGAYTVISIIKWLSLLILAVQICVLGFQIITQAKDSSDAFSKVKDKGLALCIGFLIVTGAFLIQGALQQTAKAINTAGNTTNTKVTYNNKTDVFN